MADQKVKKSYAVVSGPVQVRVIKPGEPAREFIVLSTVKHGVPGVRGPLVLVAEVEGENEN